MDVLELLFAPFKLFIRVPLLAFAPAAIFIAAALLPKAHAPRLVLWTGVAWAAYAIWETAIFVWSRSQPEGGGATIRADLLLVAPVLLILTVVAIVLWVRAAMVSTAG